MSGRNRERGGEGKGEKCTLDYTDEEIRRFLHNNVVKNLA